MSHNIAGMPPFTRMPLAGMGMGVNMGPNAPHPDSSAHPHPPPPPPAGTNPKKKRRTNSNVAQPPPQQPPSVQDLLPPPLSGYGDTIVASNPFDDTPPQTPQSPMMHGGPPHMHPHHPHHMGGPPMRGMSPLTSMGGMSPMMPHNMGNMSPMGNSPMTNHMNHMGAMSPMNHAPLGGMSPMNNMGPNMPPGPINTMNNHINMGHMGNSQLSGPPMGSPMNNMNSGPMGSPMNNMGHNMGSPMGGPLGSPMNTMGGSNHMPNGPMNMNNMNSHIPPNSPLNGPSLNNVNSPLGHNGSQPHPNHMGNNLNNLGRPMNGPMTTMSSMTSNNMNMTVPNQMNNMNMGGPGMNMPNMNISHHNQIGSHMTDQWVQCPIIWVVDHLWDTPLIPWEVLCRHMDFKVQEWVQSQCQCLQSKYILQSSQWYSIHKILTHHQFTLVGFVTRKYMIMIRQFCVNQVVIFGFTGGAQDCPNMLINY